MKTTIVFLIILLARAQSSFAQVEVETGAPFVLLSGQEDSTGGGTNHYWALCARAVIAATAGGYAWWKTRQWCRKFFGTNRPPNVPPGTNAPPTNTTSHVAAFFLDDAPPDDSDNDVVEVTINGASLETRRISPELISKEQELENLAVMGLKTLPTRESPAVYAVNGDRVNSNSISFAGGVLKWDLPRITDAPDNRFVFEWSDDLRSWTAFMTNVITAGYPLRAELPGGHGMRFYRVITSHELP